MKKSKFILATLAAAVFATSSVGLAACSDPDVGGGDPVVTFDANGSYFDGDTSLTAKEITTVEGVALQPTPEALDGYTFNGYTFTKDGNDEVDSIYVFTESTTVYASWTAVGGQQDPTPTTGVYTITLNANGGTLGATTSVQTANGKLSALPAAPTAPANKTFKGWYDAATGGTQVTTSTVFSAAATIYAQWNDSQGGQQDPTPTTGVYTITLDANGGTLGATTSVQTANGKLSALPAAPTAPANKTFKGWYDAATDGNEITTDTQFSEAATIYAQWAFMDGVYVGTTRYALSLNAGAAPRTEYWLGGSQITLAVDDVMQIYMDGELISYYVEGSSAGINKPAASAEVNSVTVTVAGPFAIYLHKNASDWSCEFAGPTAIEEGDEIPEGCAAVHITFGNGSITFYLLTADETPIGEDDLSKYCLYTFNNEIFGVWAQSTTKGKLQSEMTSTGTIASNAGWIFRWGAGYSTQTANITGLDIDGASYLITLPSGNNGTATVTKLNI